MRLWDSLGTMILAMIILPRLYMKWKVCCHAVKKLYKQKCQMEPDRFAKYRSFREESELQTGSSSLQCVRARAHAHTHVARAHKECKVIVQCTLESKKNVEL